MNGLCSEGKSEYQTTIDSKDRSILSELHQDGRLSDTEIARKQGISGASVRRRIEQMVDSGAMRLTAIVNPARIGYGISASIGMHAYLQVLDRMADLLIAVPRVHYIATARQFTVHIYPERMVPLTSVLFRGRQRNRARQP